MTKNKYVIAGNHGLFNKYLSDDGFNFILNVKDAIHFSTRGRANTYLEKYFPSKINGIIKEIRVELIN